MRVGIISFAHGHANAYADALVNMPDVELVGIADDDRERGQAAADRFKTDYFSSYDALLKASVNAVIITSENSRHREHVEAAALAGVAVLCEKPLAPTAEDAKAMINACKQAGVLLQTAFPVRFNEAIKRARNVIQEGKIGEIVAIKGTNRGKNPGGWFVDKSSSGGGAVMDHTVHVADIIRWITEKEFTHVYAEIEQSAKSAIDDSGILTMTLEDGSFATLDCSWSRPSNFPTWGDVTIEFIGTDGTLFVDAFAQKFDVYHSNGLQWTFWGDDMDAALVKDFVGAVREDLAPSITGEDGLRTVEVALAAYESSKQKRPIAIT
ncbi:NADH-dependent dyhydrogenase [Geomicrobium sp. JCM 19037]|uniref:Gfo/Idh/MocA family protein n=1 Tax=Geomicrobium sp. JCM 19037 TaxID=1460634 RepID=UPI00045F1017|nr:Gfo/Idh/MocA family oxidoreductase [Geomicrobium sp. JCM 19037]GAK02688.1 NADH-dependent dyhydrogenase [Geomicrobium sp. JCM 19037]